VIGQLANQDSEQKQDSYTIYLQNLI